MTQKRSFRFILMVLVAGFGLGLSGCSKCTTCTDCPNGVELETEEFCENDFNSKEDFDQAVDIAVGFGCTCVDE